MRTITDWLRGSARQARIRAASCVECGGEHRIHDVSAYDYILGAYLGDGYIADHARRVKRLRITLDAKYPLIIAECTTAVQRLVPGNRVHLQRRRDNCVEVGAYSRSWACLIPQAGPGKKHERKIILASWQRHCIEFDTWAFLRGLIHSDGCRFTNTGRNGWKSPRYEFANRSADIKRIFRFACELVGVHTTVTTGKSVYVSRKADVARFDEYIGPKR